MIDSPIKLPPSVCLKHGAYYFVTSICGKQKWFPLGKDLNGALKKYAETVKQNKSGKYVAKRLYSENSDMIPMKEIRSQLRNAKKNSASRNLEFNLTIEDLEAVALRSGGCCEMTGIKFNYGVAEESKAGARRKRLWAPSLDRMDSAIGYTPNNVRFVCFAVNVALQEFGDEVLVKIANALSNTTLRPALNRDK